MTAHLLLAWLVLASADGAPPPAGGGYAHVTVTERVIVRVPLPGRSARPGQARISRWRESRGPACVELGTIGGAAISEPASVDFMLRGGARVRARLASDCPGLDYYSGFYLMPTADGRICADRDSVRDRSGGACEIDRFRLLAPAGN